MNKHYLVTGGAGFIGSSYVNRLLGRGETVTIYDNLSRKGAHLNLEWLRQCHGPKSFTLVAGDVRDARLVEEAAAQVDAVVHLAGQVAVTTSVIDPRMDFENNALGTLNVLEAARASKKKPVVIYASTNKVYGGMEDVRVVELTTRHAYADLPFGVSESQQLDFHSPYGCSKGAGDQYVRDYFRIYNLPTVVFRQSCIFGPRQFGVEDQGWLAWFVIALLTGRQIMIYGDGKQVRDVLYIEDLLNAYDLAIEKIGLSAGKVYNIGGGPVNTISVWKEFEPILFELTGRQVPVSFADWRPGDQRIYVSDIRKLQGDLNWEPKVGVKEGLRKLYEWVQANIDVFK